MEKPHHNWSIDDDVVPLYLCRFPDNGLPFPVEDVARTLGIGPGTLKMRVSNFNWLHRGEGLSHPSKQSKAVYYLHKDTPQEELKTLVLRILARS